MTNRKNPNTFEISHSPRQYLGFSRTSGSSDQCSELDELEQIKDIAELWLQADLDKRDDRKVELEYELAKALPHVRQKSLGSISNIFRNVIHGSKHV